MSETVESGSGSRNHYQRSFSADAWMPLYIGDFLADTMHLNTAQLGAFQLLLMHHWRAGTVPDDDAQLAAIARVSVARWRKAFAPVLRPFFRLEDGVLLQKRLSFERDRAETLVERRAPPQGSRLRGAAARWEGGEETAGATRGVRLARARALGTHSPAEWSALTRCCGESCLKCGAVGVPLVKHHIVAVSRGGSDHIDNLQPLCGRCSKGVGPDTTDRRPSGWRSIVLPEAVAAPVERETSPGTCLGTCADAQDEPKTSLAADDVCKTSAERVPNVPGTCATSTGTSTKNPPSPSLRFGEPPPAGVGPPTRKRVQGRLPDDWQPDLAERAFAASLGLDPDEMAGIYRDYWHSRGDARSLRRDWTKTWQVWCRKEVRFRAERAARGGRPPAALGPPSRLSYLADRRARRAVTVEPPTLDIQLSEVS